MPTPTSNIRFSHIRDEFGGSNPVVFSHYYRGGARVPIGTATSAVDGVPISTSGAIRLGMFRGVSAGPPTISLTISANSTTPYNIRTAAGNPATPVAVTLTILPGVIQGGPTNSGDAFGAIDTGTGWAAGTTINIVSSASSVVAGRGGRGGASQTSGNPSAASGNGGTPGLYLRWPVTLTSFAGVMAGGGGGGAGGDAGDNGAGGGAAGGGGGGGAGYPGGSGGFGGFGIGGQGSGADGTAGSTYPTLSGGTGGRGGSGTTSFAGGLGGTGGTPPSTLPTSGVNGTGNVGDGGAGGGGLGQRGGDQTSADSGQAGGIAGFSIKTNGFPYTGSPGTLYGYTEGYARNLTGTYASSSPGVNVSSQVNLFPNGTMTKSGTGSITDTIGSVWYQPGTDPFTPTPGNTYLVRYNVLSGPALTATPGAANTWIALNSLRSFRQQASSGSPANNTTTIFIEFAAFSGGPVVNSGTLTLTAQNN